MDRTLVVVAAALTLCGCLVAVDLSEAASTDGGSSGADGSAGTGDPAGPGLDAGAPDATALRSTTDGGSCEGPCPVGEYVCARGCCPFKVETLRSSVSGGIGGFSFAIDSFGAPHVAYCNSGSNKVFYLRRSGSSTFEHPVASVSGYCGATDIEVDAAGAAHIAFSDSGAKKLYVGDLQNDGTFKIAEVAAVALAVSVDLALDASGTLHLAFASSQGGSNTSGYGTRTNGAWSIEALPVTDPALVTLTLVGSDPWIAARTSTGVSLIRRDSSGRLAVVYSAPELYENGLAVDAQLRAHLVGCSQASAGAIRNLHHVVVAGGAATAENTGSSDTGLNVSAAMRGDQSLAVAHLDKMQAQLRYSVRTDAGWTHMCVAKGVPIERSLRFDPWDHPVIGFYGFGTPSFQIASFE